MKTISILIAMRLSWSSSSRTRRISSGLRDGRAPGGDEHHGHHDDRRDAGLEAAGQREKEEELVFRGKQYVHAIGLFQRKFANAYPPNIDVLVEQRFLRKKFKDPITNDDFVPLPVGQGAPRHRRQHGRAARRVRRIGRLRR